MYSLLLAIIYIAFISLGLPDSLLGSAWPTMQTQMNVPISYAGIISMIVAGGTIVSSLLSDKLTRKLGAGLVTAVSVFLTASALFGFSVSDSIWMLCVWAVPYGLGAGAIDAALNNYVAVHYTSRHMNWLHCFWGVGATISPYIMGHYLTNGFNWNSGYRTISVIQVALTAVLFLSLPLWKNRKNNFSDASNTAEALKFSQIFRIKGAKYILISFFAYAAIESTTGLWASSYLVINRNINPETAAAYTSLFYLGITAGRFLCGFIANKAGDRNMIKIGITVMLFGIFAVWLPVEYEMVCLCGLVIIGFGCAPVYPAIIHSTPKNFGADKSQAMVGVQMASAYTGSTFMPPLFGLIANHINVSLYPIFLFAFAILMLVMTQTLNKLIPVTSQ